MSPGERTCPNCGNEAGPGVTGPRSAKPGPLPKPELSQARDEEIELELSEVTSERPIPKAAPTAKPKKKNPAPMRKRGPSPAFALDANGVRSLLAEQPGALEPGLVAYYQDGKPVGAGYSTPVGDIDLLATAKSGDLVVVSVMEKSQGEELVAEVLKRLGWVRKHLSEADGVKVRGYVLCDEPPENLSYTAAAVADTVAFKTYKVAVSFDDVEI